MIGVSDFNYAVCKDDKSIAKPTADTLRERITYFMSPEIQLSIGPAMPKILKITVTIPTEIIEGIKPYAK